MLAPSSINPRRGEIWRVRLDPVVGAEQAKTRPVVVLSEPPVGRPSVRLCAPITTYQPPHMTMPWCVQLVPDATNGLTKDSSVDVAQTRALDLRRFETKLGSVGTDKFDEIKAAVLSCIGGVPKSTV